MIRKAKRLIVSKRIQGMCLLPYPGHKAGCPKYGTSKCPPNTPLANKIINPSELIFIIYTKYDLASHIRTMKRRNPNWTDRQLRNVLYWQASARKFHFEETVPKAIGVIRTRYIIKHRLVLIRVPESHGVNLHVMMREVGIKLNWPPVKYTYLISLVGISYGKKKHIR